MVSVLRVLEEEWIDYAHLGNKVKVQGSLQAVLSNLEKVGFIEKEKDKPLSESSWKISKGGKTFLKLFDRETQEAAANVENQIVMTIPSKIIRDLSKEHPSIKFTKEVYGNLFSNAKNTIKILNPYIDASITSFLDKVNENVKIEVITVSGKFSKNNPILERQKSIRNLQVKYLEEFEGDTQIFQLHAKVILVDSNLVYIGSANFKETSILHNLEAGILSKDKEVIKSYEEIFDFIYKKYAR